ncbi:ATPase, F1/V1/A1 complex, alpha/beta subunit [Tanacetum coccineum]
MPKIRSSSKHKVRIPARFGNTVCELNKKKDGRDFSAVKVAKDVAVSMEQEEDGLVEEIVEEDNSVENKTQGGLFGNRFNGSNGIGEKVVEEFPSIAEVYSSPTPSIQVLNDVDKIGMSKTEHVTVNKIFIQAVKKNNEYKSKLELNPTCLEEGREVVVFDEEINHRVTRGSVLLLAVWGKPVMMDQTTTKMCNKGVGRIGYARVLVEVSVKNILKNKVEICYKNAKQETCLTKFVNVLYDWVPPSCELCKVFGHTHEKCLVRHRSEEEKQRISKGKNNQETRRENNGANQKSNVDAREQRNAGLGKQTTSNGNDKSGNVNVEYRPINKGLNDRDKNIGGNNEKNKGHTKNGNQKRNNGNSQFSGRWNVNKDIVDSVRRSANKYAIFAFVDEAEMGENQMNVDMSEVEKFLKKRKQPTYEESKN